MKNYIDNMVVLFGNSHINPNTLNFGDGEGSHGRSVGQITSISIHHDGQNRPHDYDSVIRYESQAIEDSPRLGPGLPYHFRIDNQGTIFATRPLTTWLNCVGSAENSTTVAICLDGYFHAPQNQLPTLEQCEALFQLLKYLCTERPDFPATWPDVRPHRDFSQTACPGDNLAPYVLSIQDEASALNFPANSGYDWPDLQATPAASVPAKPAPAPATPPTPPAPSASPAPAPSTPTPVPVQTPLETAPIPPNPPKITPNDTTAAGWFAGFTAFLKVVWQLIKDRFNGKVQ